MEQISAIRRALLDNFLSLQIIHAYFVLLIAKLAYNCTDYSSKVPINELNELRPLCE